MDYLYFKELYHHGIKGQKWGVRNYQNPDGSLTAEGKERYGTVGPDYKISKKEIKKEVEEKGSKIGEKYWKDMEECEDKMIKIAKKYDNPNDEYTLFDENGGALDDFWNFGDSLDEITTPSTRKKITEKDREEYKKLYYKNEELLKKYNNSNKEAADILVKKYGTSRIKDTNYYSADSYQKRRTTAFVAKFGTFNAALLGAIIGINMAKDY